MLKDIGFWNKNGVYMEDYQEVGDEEMALSINDTNKLEQENAELKALSEELGKIIECKNGTIATLAKTRDELKAKAQILSDELDKYKSVVLKQLEEIERLKEELDFLKNNTYREALREIREYINDNTDFDKGDYIQSKTAAYDILQIIALYGE